MSNSKRALRRHHRARLNNYTHKIITSVWVWNNDTPDIRQWRVNRMRDNMKMCSCSGCCNKRNKRSYTKSWQCLTLQEIRQLDSEIDQWKEVDIPTAF